MDEELLKRIRELESENEYLRHKTSLQNKSRTPLNSIPVSSVSQSTPISNTTPVSQSLADDNILYYLKSVLGYTIKHQENRIILRSVYSFSSEDVFEIEIQDNKLMLRNTDYLQEWSEFFNIYIKNGRSYCAFFAAVTLELYNRKTFGK